MSATGSTLAREGEESDDDTALSGCAALSQKGPVRRDMLKRTSTIALLLLVLAGGVSATDRLDRTSASLLSRTWPAAPHADLSDLGAGLGIVFSPDLSVKDNCRFYAALGFACFESADWLDILSDIHKYNVDHPGRRIRTLILETHGTNGHGLKVQTGKNPKDERSYVSVGALQEMLEPVGVRFIIISACNSGRLLRPEIYRRLNRDPGDKLFLPASRGIIDATDEFDPRRSKVEIITPATSHIETTLVGGVRELAPSTRAALSAAAREHDVRLPRQFAISEMLIKMLLRDPALRLRAGEHYVEELSKEQTPPEASERLFGEFVAHLDFVAAREGGGRTAAASAAAR